MSIFIGMHCFEVAKTIWNAFVQSYISNTPQLLDKARTYLDMARDNLHRLEPEDDENMIIKDVDTLYTLLNEVTACNVISQFFCPSGVFIIIDL